MMDKSFAGKAGLQWFTGVVEDNADPKELGRVRVRIVNHHDESIPTDKLKWATVMMPTTTPSSGGVGSSPTWLTKGTNVMGLFLDSSAQLPMVIGTWHGVPDGDDAKHDVSGLARGKNSIEKEAIGPEPESSYAAKYPDNKTIVTPRGHVIEIDDTKDQERLHVYHRSGAYVEINKDGQIVIKSMANNYEIVVGDKDMYVRGTVTIHSEENIFVKADANIKMEAKNNIEINATKILDLNGGLFVRANGKVIA